MDRGHLEGLAGGGRILDEVFAQYLSLVRLADTEPEPDKKLGTPSSPGSTEQVSRFPIWLKSNYGDWYR